MKKRNIIIFTSIFLVVAITTSGLLFLKNRRSTSGSGSSNISFPVISASGSEYLPPDATEAEILEYALGDILEIEPQDGQEEIGTLTHWDTPVTTPSAFLDVTVGNSRDILIHHSAFGASESLTVINPQGEIIHSENLFTPSPPIRITNLDAGTYRIEVRRYKDFKLHIILRVFSELTTPEITLPELVAKQLVTVKNPYKVPLQVTLPSGTHTVPREATLPIPLAEGDNELEMHLADNGFVSPSITSAIFADTTPPEITITGTYIDEKTRRYLIDYTVSEPIKRLVINGKELPAINREPRGPGYRSCTFHIDNYPEYLVIEVTDLVGLTTKFSVKFADLDFVEEPAYP